jgi:amidase
MMSAMLALPRIVSLMSATALLAASACDGAAPAGTHSEAIPGSATTAAKADPTDAGLPTPHQDPKESEERPQLGVLELQTELEAGRLTSEALVENYLDRIAAIDRDGPRLQAILSLNPDALEQARSLDAERRSKGARGPMHGIPILIKDNIETKDPVATTAGSLALKDNVTKRDAPVVARLRASGAIILGKANLSEWANIRSSGSTSGWSAMGGLTRNPHVLDRSACGSSSGSAVAVAADLAAAALGTETDGSVVCPSSVNGIVGLKPTVGLVSRTHIVPISHSQDTAGPMTKTVADAAAMLTVMAGSDAADPMTVDADDRRRDYSAALDANALRGKRIGVMRFAAGYHAATDEVFEAALEDLREAGAKLVEIEESPEMGPIDEGELEVLLTELKADMNAYLASTPAAVETRDLEQLIAFNEAHADREMPFFGQSLFELAQAKGGLDDPAYLAARKRSLRAAGVDGIDAMLKTHELDALVAPTIHPAWSIDPIVGDHFLGAASTLAAVSGYPHLTVPMGHVHQLPVGLSFLGPAYSEAELLALGYAYEQRSNGRPVPKMLPSLSAVPEARAHLDRGVGVIE